MYLKTIPDKVLMCTTIKTKGAFQVYPPIIYIIISCRGSLSQKFNVYNYANGSVFCDKIKKSLVGAEIKL